MTDNRCQKRVLRMVDSQVVSDGTVATFSCVEMLRVDSAFCVNLIIPDKHVAHGGFQGVVVGRIDIQCQGDDFVTSIVVADGHLINTGLVEGGIFKVVRERIVADGNGTG